MKNPAHPAPLLPLRTPLCAALLGLGALLLSSCASPEFSRSWRSAARPARPPAGIDGAWKGTWESKATGHTGELRCVVNPVPGKANTYDFHYWASWKRVLAGDYHVTYAVRRQGEKYVVTGEKDLGEFLGGVYTHRGVATSTQFDATYKAEKDHGSFTMTRPFGVPIQK